MAETPNVCLSLSNRPENVLVVRQALTGVADSLGLDAIETNDLNTAVTEACNNVVLHAYAGGEGPLEVDVFALADGLAVTVRDRGGGIGLRPSERHPDDVHGGIGVPVINALSRHAEFKDLDGGGQRCAWSSPRPMPRRSTSPTATAARPAMACLRSWRARSS